MPRDITGLQRVLEYAELQRRRFLIVMGGAAGMVVAACRKQLGGRPATPAPPSTLNASELALLHELLAILLPSTLSAQDVADEARSFQDWLAGYDPGAQASHAWIRPTRPVTSFRVEPSPLPAYRAQLAKLQARRNAGESLDAIVREHLGKLTVQAVPNAQQEQHPEHGEHDLVLDLLAFFYRKPKALDLLYRRRIDALACRDLAGAGDEPKPL